MAFRSVLIANRGEIALRILRACKVLGLRTVVVFSESDRNASYVALADQAVCIGPGPAKESYLNQRQIILAALATGAEAVHPGYGFLAENADFAELVRRAGLCFIGPEPETIRLMGNKIAAKQAMHAAGVPCVGGSGSLPDDLDECRAIASALGFPAILKAEGGGGGRGMRVVNKIEDLEQALAATRTEARHAFGNASVYLEHFLQHPRHIEIQVLCDSSGNAIWLDARDCSVQRRHQKIIEETPAPGIPAAEIQALGRHCVRACRDIGYLGVGTFEFLYQDGAFSFIEMNTRIQVEHTVSEAISGIDIVVEQIRIAAGFSLSISQADIVQNGHAIECRINAEDPATGSPSPGRLTEWHAPGGAGIRVDTHMVQGAEIPAHYDSLLAKIIAHGRDRADAITRMQGALREVVARGVSVNTALHTRILDDAAFVHGGVTIHYLETRLEDPGWLVSPEGRAVPQ